MTAEEFNKDPGRRKALADALADPILIEAMVIAKESMEPAGNTQADAVPAIAAALFHQVAGANTFRKRLRNMAREPIEKKVIRARTQNARSEDEIPE